MRRHVPAGIFLAVLASLLVLLSDTLGLDAQGITLLGAAIGGALGLVPDRSALQRIGGFAVGFGAAWIGYLLRAALLPDAASGRAVAVLLVLLGCLAVAMATRGRLPLWASLLGAAAMAGSYESVYAGDPTAFLTTAPASASAVLVAVGAGFLATALLAPRIERDRAAETARHLDDAESVLAEAELLLTELPLEPTPEA